MYCYNKTRKYNIVRVAPRTLVKAVLNVSSTGCNNEQQSFAKLPHSTMDNVLTNLLPAGLQDFFQVLNVSNMGVSLDYSAVSFLVPQILVHEDTLVNGHVFIFTSTTSAMTSHRILITYIHTYTRLMALFPGLPRWAGTRKVKPIWISLKQETVSGSGIRWAICKSAPHSRQMTTPAPHHSFFTGRMPFLPPNQQRQSTEGT